MNDYIKIKINNLIALRNLYHSIIIADTIGLFCLIFTDINIYLLIILVVLGITIDFLFITKYQNADNLIKLYMEKLK